METNKKIDIDDSIIVTAKVISDNIDLFKNNNRGIISQNILGQLRNLIEYIAQRFCSTSNDPNDYKDKKKALESIKGLSKCKCLTQLHSLLQKSTSHYTLDQDASERLMLKYIEYLFEIKTLVYEEWHIEILDNLNKFPIYQDNQLKDYYKEIGLKIENPIEKKSINLQLEIYYVNKVKPFFTSNKMYYEVTLSPASSISSKFERVIVFSKKKILTNYGIKIRAHQETIKVLGKEVSIVIIDDWWPRILKKEFNLLFKIFEMNKKITSDTKEYINIMNYIKNEMVSLSEIVCFNEQKYESFIKNISVEDKSTSLSNLLNEARTKIVKKENGYNIIRYLLYTMKYRIIKDQMDKTPNKKLSGLYLKNKTIPFDEMPICTSLVNHNPSFYDITMCFFEYESEEQYFYRFIKNQTENKGHIFTKYDDVIAFDNIDALIKRFNRQIYVPSHECRKLRKINRSVYIEKYAGDCYEILNKLISVSYSKISNYTNCFDLWIKTSKYEIDCDEKKNLLKNMFQDSKLSVIYGSAGTGKSTLIKHIANYFDNKNKIFIANTNPAVSNLRRKITVKNSNFMTITKYFKENTNEEIMFIDECSTVSNEDMVNILHKSTAQIIVLVGDIYQIDSIKFGNWFSLLEQFIPENSIHCLETPYRTKNINLLQLWECVRKKDDSIEEILAKYKYCSNFDETFFRKDSSDEIVLTLNYDGLYGVNNVNRLLQSNNPNKPFYWGIGTYKVGDPVLFNETQRFAKILYNNQKGTITKIETQENKIIFEIKIEEIIDEEMALYNGITIIKQSLNEGTTIRFSVAQFKNPDDDDENDSTVIPFQVAYAVSIHKAQGLEYNSVKVIISQEVGEKITHNIFYTAITRAREKLKIYWSPETQKQVLTDFKSDSNSLDSNFIKQLYFPIDFKREIV